MSEAQPEQPDADRMVMIYTTCETPEEAKTIARELVNRKLAACANIFAGMTAVFEWDGTAQEGEETAMFVKTRAGLAAEVTEEIKRLHSYDVPAVAVLEVSGGNTAFLDWVAEQTVPQK
jgi:periplasmic divalent cation tolerance protein